MASYHRVLQLFQRSVDDKTLECNCDVHAWHVSINGKSWTGKIRLIGYLDVFFLILYTGDSRFEEGIIIYKEDDMIRDILADFESHAESIGLAPINQKDVEKKSHSKKYFSFTSFDTEYVVTSLGHKIGLKKTYDPSCLKSYEIKITKDQDLVWRRRVRRGISQHTTFQLGQDLIRLGFVSQADLITGLSSRFLIGGIADDSVRKYIETLSGGRSAA